MYYQYYVLWGIEMTQVETKPISKNKVKKA